MLTLYITNTQLTLVAPLHSENKVQWCSLRLSFEIFDPISCGKSLKAFVEDNRLVGNSTVLAISAEHALFREVVWDAPFLDWQVYQSIQTNFNQYFPGCLSSEFGVDFEVINSQDDRPGMPPKLQLCAAPKAILESYIAAMVHAGLKVKAVDIDALALGAIFRNLEFKASDSLKIGVAIEADEICLIKQVSHGIPRLQKTILSGEKSSNHFLSFFQTFIEEDAWNLSEVFYIKETNRLLSLLDILKDHLGVQAYPVDLFKQLNPPPELTDYPLSLAVHCGLRGRHVN